MLVNIVSSTIWESKPLVLCTTNYSGLKAPCAVLIFRFTSLIRISFMDFLHIYYLKDIPKLCCTCGFTISWLQIASVWIFRGTFEMLLPIIACKSETGNLDLSADRCYYIYATLERKGILPSFLAVYPSSVMESCLH